jgi:hypothetical protein
MMPQVGAGAKSGACRPQTVFTSRPDPDHPYAMLLKPGDIGYHAHEPITQAIPFMSDLSTIVLVPFFFAFLIFVMRFYSRESASSMTKPSFLLAVGTMLSAGAFLLLRVLDIMPSYGPVAFGGLGLILLALAVTRMVML